VAHPDRRLGFVNIAPIHQENTNMNCRPINTGKALRGASGLIFPAVLCGLAALCAAAPPDPQPAKRLDPTMQQLPPSVQRDLAQQSGTPGAPPIKQVHGAIPAAQPSVELKPGEEPMIEFDMPVYDFGRVKSGVDVVHDFWFTNTGTGPLEIIQVKPS